MAAFLAPLAVGGWIAVKWLAKQAFRAGVAVVVRELNKTARDRFGQLQRQRLKDEQEQLLAIVEQNANADQELVLVARDPQPVKPPKLTMPPMWARDP